MRTDFLRLRTPAVPGNGEALAVRDYLDHTVQFAGTFAGTVDVQVSHDGTTWFTVQAAVAAVALYYFPGSFKYMRLVTTAVEPDLAVHYGGVFQRDEA